jgi:antitoxin ParD1/3/4
MPRNIELGLELDAIVEKLVAEGRYASVGAVLRAGVELVNRREARLVEIDEAISEGMADAEAGRVHDVEDVCSRLEIKYAAMDKRSAS